MSSSEAFGVGRAREGASVDSDVGRGRSLMDVSWAIAIAVPYMTVLGFDSLSRCFEACAVGAVILRSHGFEANVVPADALVCEVGQTGKRVAALGTPRDVPGRLERYHRIPWTDAALLPSGQGSVVHAVIQCGRWVVDPTIGQVNEVHRGLLPAVGLCMENAFETESCQHVAGTTVSWHLRSDSRLHQDACLRELRPFEVTDRAEDSYRAACTLAVASLLDAGLDRARWFHAFPLGTLRELTRRLLALGHHV